MLEEMESVKEIMGPDPARRGKQTALHMRWQTFTILGAALVRGFQSKIEWRKEECFFRPGVN